MLTMFTLLAVAGGALRLVLQWQMKARWGLSLALPQTLAELCPKVGDGVIRRHFEVA
jgi:hypothetical protein